MHRPAALVTLALFFGLLLWGYRIQWLPWTEDCAANASCYPAIGETHQAVIVGHEYLLTGPRYWLIQRYATGTFYTHNLFLGGFLYYASALIFSRPFVPAVLVTLAAFCAGLFYGYLFVQRASGSRLFGLIFLGLMATDYYYDLVYAFNLLRGWSWLAFFGAAYHALRLTEPCARRRVHLPAFAGCVLVALGIGYDWAISAAILTVLVTLVYTRPRRPAVVARALALVLAVWGGWFMLRQLQIIGGLGLAFWVTDLRYALTVKTSFVATLFGAPTLQEMADYYAGQHVLWFGLMIDNNPLNWWPTIVRYWHELWEPTIGAATLPLVGGSLGLAGLLVTLNTLPKAPPAVRELARAATVVLLVAVAQVLGLYVFAYESLMMYLSQRFPLVIAGLLLAYAFGVYVVVWLVQHSGAKDRAIRVAAMVALGLLVGYRAYTVSLGVTALPVVNYPAQVRNCLESVPRPPEQTPVTAFDC